VKRLMRLNRFDTLPGVWEKGAFYDTVWSQIRRQLKKGGVLNKAERAVLVELVDRVAALRPKEARKALGIRRRPPTAERNERIADLYIRLYEFEGKTREAAEAAVMAAFPNVGDATVCKILESNKWLAPARTRQLVEHMRKKYPKK
jgi:hypothetical protein